MLGLNQRYTKLKLAQTLLCPFLTVADVITGELPNNVFLCLQRAFNGIIRFVFELRKFDHILHSAHQLVGLPLDKYMIFRRLIFIFNIIKNKQLEYLYDRLEFSRSRRTCNINVPAYNYYFAAKSFFVSNVCNWNELNHSIKKSTSLNMFKKNLKDFLYS